VRCLTPSLFALLFDHTITIYQRIVDGPDRDAWYHPHFLKGQPSGLTKLKRVAVKKNHIDADAIGFKSMQQIDDDGRDPKEKTNDEAKVAAGGFENKIVHEADLIDGRMHQEVAIHPMSSLFSGHNHDTQGTVHASDFHLTPNDRFKVTQELHQKASSGNRPSVSYVQHGQLQQQHKFFTMENEVPACQPRVLNSVDYTQHEQLWVPRPSLGSAQLQLQQHKPFTMENEVPACQPHVLNLVSPTQLKEFHQQNSAFTIENKVDAWQPNERPPYNGQIGNDINGMVQNQAVNSFAPSSSVRRVSSIDSVQGNSITMPSIAQAFPPNEYASLCMMRMMQLQQSFPSSTNGAVHNQLQQSLPPSFVLMQQDGTKIQQGYPTFIGRNGVFYPQNQGEAHRAIGLAPVPFTRDLYDPSEDEFLQFLGESLPCFDEE
jgi:hypothetical protein